eukprot:12391.XXX_281620_281850_1 [CDS] Oithona nana genome sequencing.
MPFLAHFISRPHGGYACNLNVIRLAIVTVRQIKFHELANNFKAWWGLDRPLAMQVRWVTPRKSWRKECIHLIDLGH